MADEPQTPDSREIVDLQKQLTRLEDRLTRYKSGERIIRAAVEDVFSTGPSVRLPPRPRPVRASRPLEEIAVLHVSDTQLGKATVSYNLDVARKRIALLAQKVIEITAVRRKAASIEELHLYLGGDLVEGENIFPHQAHLIDAPLLDQAVRRGPEIFVRLILSLLGDFRVVRVFSVPGNHGRSDLRGHPQTNWDNVCAEVVKCSLLGSGESPRPELADRLSFTLAEDFFLVDTLPGGWGNLLVHGDQISGGFAGIPFYGVTRAMAGWSDSIPTHWDYLWFGHFHTYASMVWNTKMWLANGTTESDNEYARERMKSANVPCQRLSFFNRKHGLISDHQIVLASTTPQSRRRT